MKFLLLYKVMATSAILVDCTDLEARMAFANIWESPVITSGSLINLPPLMD